MSISVEVLRGRPAPSTRMRIVSFAVALFAVVAIVGFAQPARATNYSGASGVYTNCSPMSDNNKADNSNHTYFYNSTEAATTNAFEWARTNAVNTELTSTVLGSMDSATDMVVNDQYYTSECGRAWWTASSGGVAGIATCHSLNGSNECEQHYVRISLTYVNNSSTGTSQERSLATHESGHTLGLRHRTSGSTAMRTDTSAYTNYDGHDLGHLDLAY